jgi:hypothetical protein
MSYGINLAYFSNINAKINFLSSILMNFKHKNIFFIDFDTIFSSYINTNALKYNMNNFPDIKIILPQIENLDFIFKDVINSLSCNSVLILDSLNGLIDSLNMYNIFKKKETYKHNNKLNSWDKTSSRLKFTGYQSLNILFLLVKKLENKRIPIVVTAYQSIEKSKKMIDEMISNKGLETNHYIRISNLVIFLEFIEKDFKTGFTIIKKNYHASLSNADLFSTFGKSAKDFHPYSRWFYYDFFNL